MEKSDQNRIKIVPSESIKNRIFQISFLTWEVIYSKSVQPQVAPNTSCNSLKLLTTDELVNGIFDVKHREYDGTEFSWICSDSPWKPVENCMRHFFIELMFEKEVWTQQIHPHHQIRRACMFFSSRIFVIK